MSEEKSSSRKTIRKVVIASVIILVLLGIFSLISGPSKKDWYDGKEAEALKEVANFTGDRPNVIIIMADDLGVGDLTSYGGTSIKTPNLDSLSGGGMRFNDFYSCNAICAPSRSGLLTGRYPIRTGIISNVFPENESMARWLPRKIGDGTLRPLGALDLADVKTVSGLGQFEQTLAEALKLVGYKTGMVGKWHLGDFTQNPEFNPVNNGFDRYYGVPHSNDMMPCQLYSDLEEIEENIGLGERQEQITGDYTREALKFLEESKDDPFFLYFAHTFPHQPLHASDDFKNKSMAGKYGDAVEEIDWSVGKIMQFLKDNNLEENTIVLFTSDNGPWFEGSSGGLRGRKGQSYEGGFRIPLIAKWPRKIPAGTVCEQTAMNIDIFPTILALAGVELPTDRVIDGKDMIGLLTGTQDKPTHEAFYFYHYDKLEGIRMGDWKYFSKINRYVWPVPLDNTGNITSAMAGKQIGKRWPLLYNVKTDPSESYNVLNKYPEKAKMLKSEMDKWIEESGITFE